jgi:hypothetical protein
VKRETILKRGARRKGEGTVDTAELRLKVSVEYSSDSDRGNLFG